MTFIKNHSKDILIFLLLILIVGWLQYYLLAPHLKYGFTPDDWWPLAHYKFVETNNLLSNILEIWKQEGIYTSYQVFYITILHNLFRFDFQLYQLTNHILKALSALALYPTVAIIFKNRLLAFVTTILYAMAYSPVGTLEIAAKGSDFIAIIFICIFFILYYYKLIGVLKGEKWTFFLLLILTLCMMFSAIRTYPVLAFIIAIETYLVIIKRTRKVLVDSLKRLLILFSPYLLMFIISPSSILRFLNINAPEIIRRIDIGNWQLILHPLGSFGSLFLLNDYWKIFESIQTQGLKEYIGYLLVTPLIIFVTITLFYTIIFSIPSKRFFKFFLKILTFNIFFQILVFFIFKHSESIPVSIRVGYNSTELYPVFFAIYILLLSFFAYFEWSREKKNNLLLALWLGVVFSFSFIVLTWILANYVVIFKGVHSYLNVPSIGASLFISATLVLFYQKIKSIKFIGKSLALLVFLLLIPIFYINKNIIQYYWALSSYSMDAKEQQGFRDRVWSALGNFDNSRPTLFYFATLDDLANGRFYEQTMLGRFSEWMFFQSKFEANKCLLPVFLIDKLDVLKKSITIREGEKGFSYHTYCGEPHFYRIADLYAFNLINKQPINIKENILTSLGLNLKNE